AMVSTSKEGKTFNDTEQGPRRQRDSGSGARPPVIPAAVPVTIVLLAVPSPVQVVTLNRHLVVVLAVAVALAGGALLVRGMAPEPAPADLAFPFLDGRTVSLNDLYGRPVLVTFWATTCPVC